MLLGIIMIYGLFCSSYALFLLYQQMIRYYVKKI